MKRTLALYRDQIYLIAALALSFPLLFQNALEYSDPIGFAGLFTQMAGQIADANYRLPMTTPFYGPSGVPFAYPPLGLYLLAVWLKLTGEYSSFLRFVPPLVSLLSLIPLYYLMLRLSKSSLASALTVILAATSSALYIENTWAAGIVRAPGFLFALGSIYFFVLHQDSRSQLHILLSGIFLGLSLMSHLIYFLFNVAWIGWWAIYNKKIFVGLKDLLLAGIVGSVTASLWLITILSRYGFDIFINAFSSHGGQATLSLWKRLSGLLGVFWRNLDPITSNTWFTLLVVLGLLSLLAKKEFRLILFFILITLAFPSNERFVFLMGCIIAGMGVSLLLGWISNSERTKWISWGVAVFLVPVMVMIWWNGYQNISRFHPLVYPTTFDFAQQVQKYISPKDTFLALIDEDESEWLPFLFQREPVVSQWGSEWLGTYNQQTICMVCLGECRAEEDWACVENVILDMDLQPDTLVTYKRDEKLNQQISQTDQWKQVLSNKRYVLWIRAE